MPKINVIAVAGLVALLVAVLTQLAWVPAAYAAPPSGSYNLTCKGSYTKDDTLFSTCQHRRGGYVNTTLRKWSLCRGDISNHLGSLHCNFPTIPAGSYSSSCKDIFEDEGTHLLAICKTIRGRYRNAELKDYKECRKGSIDNIDGILICDRPSS